MDEECIFAEAYRLQEYIKHYVPSGFREEIHIFDFTPSITKETYLELIELKENGKLKDIMEDKEFRLYGGRKYRWYIKEAILSFFDGEINVKK